MSSLTSRQRKYLRGLAHGLDPVVQVGRQGLSEAVLAEVDRALECHELIKVKLAGDRDQREGWAQQIGRRLGAETAGLIGRVGIFYRPHRDPEERKIRLPEPRTGE